MTDYASFKWGGVTYPLGSSGGNSALRDVDKLLFHTLPFFKFCLETFMGARFLEEAGLAGASHITQTVADQIPYNVEDFLASGHYNFPLLCAWRTSSDVRDRRATHRGDDSRISVAWAMPPLKAGEMEVLAPFLKGARDIIDFMTHQGFHPDYTPAGSTAGESVWKVAGIEAIQFVRAEFGHFRPTEDLAFPCVLMDLQVLERSDAVPSQFSVLDGTDINIDLTAQDGTKVSNFVQAKSFPAPTLTSLDVATGSKAGGTTVTATGTGFIVNTQPRVTVGGVEATSVVVLSATQVRFVTPAHDAYDTFAADVVVINPDGQYAELEAAFTYTTP